MTLKAAHDKDPIANGKRWLNPGPNTQGSAVYIPDRAMPDAAVNPEDYEQEDGILKDKAASPQFET